MSGFGSGLVLFCSLSPVSVSVFVRKSLWLLLFGALLALVPGAFFLLMHTYAWVIMLAAAADFSDSNIKYFNGVNC